MVGPDGVASVQKMPASDPLASNAVISLIEDREALYLAMLLHDVGKGGGGGQEKAGARAARQACERLGQTVHAAADEPDTLLLDVCDQHQGRRRRERR